MMLVVFNQRRTMKRRGYIAFKIKRFALISYYILQEQALKIINKVIQKSQNSSALET